MHPGGGEGSGGALLLEVCICVCICSGWRSFLQAGSQNWITRSLVSVHVPLSSVMCRWPAFVWLLVCSFAYYNMINTREPATPACQDLNHDLHCSYTFLNPSPNLIAINLNPPFFISLPFFPLGKVFFFGTYTYSLNLNFSRTSLKGNVVTSLAVHWCCLPMQGVCVSDPWSGS